MQWNGNAKIMRPMLPTSGPAVVRPGLEVRIPGLPGTIPGLEVKGRLKIQSSSFNIYGGIAAPLIHEYNRHLVEDLGMMRRRDVKKKDIVDLRPILRRNGIENWEAPDPALTMDEKLHTVDDYYYCYIPCFEEGVYLVNDNRYIYWKMTDLDLAGHRMMLWLQDFVFYDGEGSGWQPGVYGNVAWRFGDPEDEMSDALAGKRRMKCEYAATEDAVTDYVKLYRLIDVKKDLGWTGAKLDDWEGWVMDYAKQSCEAMLRKTGQHNLDCLAAMFTSYTVKVNKILSDHKNARKSRPVSDKEHELFITEKKEAAEKGGAKPKERRIRTIGPISVTSKEAPRPGRRAAANYKKTAWETRGHIRTLRSGKKVPVRKSIHRRKALLTPENAGIMPEKTPVTVRILPQDGGEK